MDKMRWVSLRHIRYFFSGLYVGHSTRYRYLIMVLNRVMVVNKFILVSLLKHLTHTYFAAVSVPAVIYPSIIIVVYLCSILSILQYFTQKIIIFAYFIIWSHLINSQLLPTTQLILLIIYLFS